MGTFITIAQFLLSLSILITLHECGHFFPAKWFKARVEKFYLFFDPWFELFKVKKGETEYGIGWLPLGGYVKISGMIDESMDKAQMAKPPKPWEFRSKPAWQRFIIMIGGVTVNFFLGIFIFGMLFWTQGDLYLPAENAPHGIVPTEIGKEIGLQAGDQLLRVGDQEVKRLLPMSWMSDLLTADQPNIVVRRDGTEKSFPISDDIYRKLTSYKHSAQGIISHVRFPVTVAQVAEGMGAEKADIKVDDKIIAINAQPAQYYDQMVKILQDNAGKTVSVEVLRGQDTVRTNVQVNAEAKLGIGLYGMKDIFDFEKQNYGFGTSMVKGYQRATGFLADQLTHFGKMFQGKIDVQESLGGPIAIAKMFGPRWDWIQFWNLTGTLSIILAFMNLLPIPGLDGGHLVFVIYEMIVGRKPSDKVVEKATMVGFLILMLFMIFVFYNDISRLIGG